MYVGLQDSGWVFYGVEVCPVGPPAVSSKEKHTRHIKVQAFQEDCSGLTVLVIITKNGLKYSRHARRCVHMTDHEFCMLLLCLQTRYPSLKKLAKEILGLDIQSREHSPVSEKITAAMFKNCHWRFLYPVLLVLLDFLKGFS